jgi:hypothetical protein
MTPQTAEVSKSQSSLRDQVIADYQSGLSLWTVQNRWAAVFNKSEVKRILTGIMRPKGSPKSEPSEEEVALLRDEIKSKWTPEQASRRWVGRYLSRPESLGEGLSRELRRIGGNC